MIKEQIHEEDMAEIVKFLEDHSQYYKATVVTFLYNFYRMQVGTKRSLEDHQTKQKEE